MSKSPARPARRLFLVFLLTLASAALLAQGAMALSVSLYRYYNPGNGDHFYSTDFYEASAGFSFEWVQGYVYTYNYTGSLVPLYRYYNSGTSKYFYTTNYNELGGGAQGFAYQKIAAWVNP